MTPVPRQRPGLASGLAVATLGVVLALGFGIGPARAVTPSFSLAGPQLDNDFSGDALDPDPDSGISADRDEPQACPRWILRDGVELPDIPELYHRMRPGRAFGTPELVDLVVDSAALLAWERPNADPFVVGDMSRRRGGLLEGHVSHQGGIDADIGLFYGDGQQHATAFRPPTDIALDTETTWLLIRSMLESGQVERILIDQAHINRLRRHAIEIGDLTAQGADRVFPTDRLDRWRDGIIHHAAGHRDHLHVRVRCER